MKKKPTTGWPNSPLFGCWYDPHGVTGDFLATSLDDDEKNLSD